VTQDFKAEAVKAVAGQPWCAVVAVVAMIGGFGFAYKVGMALVTAMADLTKMTAVMASDISAIRAHSERMADGGRRQENPKREARI
jgi:hypothetical protein